MKFGFFFLVAYLLFTQARAVEWQEVFAAIKRRPAENLARAATFGIASFALYSCFDLLGKHYTRHALAAPRVMTINFVSYAFNLNLGALIGGIAFRYRLYTRYGLSIPTITQVLFFSMLTNWLGYVLLCGIVFTFWPIQLPPDWKLDTGALPLLGACMLTAVGAYLLAVRFSRRRIWTVRKHRITLPSLPLALVQLAISSVNWLLMACAVYLLLEQKITFTDVLSVLLLAAIAGVITHVPAGLGVLEAVFVALLSHQMAASELLAALLLYRFIYYLFPLAVATVVYIAMEARAKREAALA